MEQTPYLTHHCDASPNTKSLVCAFSHVNFVPFHEQEQTNNVHKNCTQLLPHTLVHKTIYLLFICASVCTCTFVIGLMLVYYHMYTSRCQPVSLMGSISYKQKADTGTTKQNPFFLSSLLSYAPSSLIVVSVVVFAPFTSPVVFFCKFRIKYTKVRFSFFLNALLCDLKVKLYQSK